MKTNLAIISLLIGISACQDLSPLLGYCANPPKTLPKTLSDKIALPTSYRISGSVTNWKEASTSLITETGSEEYRVFEKHSRALLPEKWIQSLSGDKQFMLVNLTSGDCQVSAAKPDIFPNMPRFKSIIGDDHSSVYSIIQGLIEFDKTHAGFLAEDHRVEVVGGVNSIKWVTCVSGATSNDSVVLVEVRYAGEDAISPAQSQFSNPLLLSIRLAELPNFNSTVPINHISIEIDRYEVPTSYDPSVAHGVYCENRTFVTLPLKPLEEYAAVLNYFDHAKNRSEVVEVFYSKSRQIFIVAGDSFENGVKILKSSPDRYPNGTDYILHDFKYGYEFTMSREACESFSSLDNSTEDVFYDKSSILTLKPMERLLVDSALSWSAYQNDVDMYGKSYKTFRAFDPRDETIQELHLTDDGEVISIATFRMGSRHLTVTVTVTRIPMESSRLNLKAAQLSNCYDDGKFANNTWIMQMKDKKLSDVSKVGINRLNEAVAESISKNVYPVIPYRIVVFYVENKDHGLSIILRIAEKTEKMPAPVVGYNYTAELTNFELFNMLNNSIALEKMPIEVQTVDGAKEEWMAVANTVRMFSPGNDTGFIGYTGGSMFVLAIFCLIIGVTIGTVGLFVVTRRQRISTLAYQVFE